jgi:hypothetical protein
VFTALRVCRRYRADEGNRTPNLLITNQLLYQLSYVSLKQAEKRQTPMIRVKLGRVNFLRAFPALFSSPVLARDHPPRFWRVDKITPQGYIIGSRAHL